MANLTAPLMPQIQNTGFAPVNAPQLDYSPLFAGGGIIGGLASGIQKGQQMAATKQQMQAHEQQMAQKVEQDRQRSIVMGAAEIKDLPPQQQLSKLQQRRARLQENGLPTETTDEAIELLQTDYDAFQQGIEQSLNYGYTTGMLKPAAGAGYTESKIPGYAFNKGTGRLEVASETVISDESKRKADAENRKLLKEELDALDTTFDRSKAIRGEYENKATEFKKVRGAYDRVQASIEDPDAAGDIALIFNYMKMLDPGSTVREGEFATAQNAGSAGSNVYNMYNRLMSGERLNENQRKMFSGRAQKLFDKVDAQNNRDVKDTLNLGKRYGLSEEDIFGPDTDPTEATPGKPPANAVEAAPDIPDGQTANNGELISQGGYWVPNDAEAAPEEPANSMGAAVGMDEGMTGTLNGEKYVVKDGFWVPQRKESATTKRSRQRRRNR